MMQLQPVQVLLAASFLLLAPTSTWAFVVPSVDYRQLASTTTTALQSSTLPFVGRKRHLRSNNDEMPAGVHASIAEINSQQEFQDFLAKDDRLCVVKFHAAWCKSCQRFGMKYQGLAQEVADCVDSQNNIVKEGAVRMGAIEFGANKELCKSLNIKRLPTVHFYQHGKKVAGFPCGPAKFALVQETIEHHLLSGSQKTQSDLEHTLSQGDALMKQVSATAADQKQTYEQQLAQAYANNSGSSSSAEDGTPTKNRSWWRRG